MGYFSDLNIMSAFLACFLCDIQHPGVNNPFLIAMRHTKALRYNDKSVLESHHCAIAFKLLLDPQNDVFELLSEAQYWGVRQIIIKMIMSSDISNHFEQISKSKSASSSPNACDLITILTCYFSDIQGPCCVQKVPRRHHGGQVADNERGSVLLRPRCSYKNTISLL